MLNVVVWYPVGPTVSYLLSNLVEIHSAEDFTCIIDSTFILHPEYRRCFKYLNIVVASKS